MLIAKTDLTTWFVAQLRPHGLALARKHLHRQGFITFSPEIENGCGSQLEARKNRRPLFPGYLFVSFCPSTNGWTVINNTRGVPRLILTDSHHPRALPEQLMAELFSRCDSSKLFKSSAPLEVEDRIRIISGSFSKMVTQIKAIPNDQRLFILVDFLGRQVRSS